MKSNHITETGRERFAKLKAELAKQRDPRSGALLQQLDRCGVDWNGRYTCRLPACPDCKRRNSARRAEEANSLFSGLRNDDVVYVTVVAGATQSPAEVFALLSKAQEDTRSRRKSARRIAARWGGTRFLGWSEIDAVAGFQVPMLPPGRAGLISKITPIPIDSHQPTYVPTYHALMHLNGIDIADVRNTFGKQWKLDGQVDVRPLRAKQSFEWNVTRIASYSTKFSSLTELTLDRKGCKWLDPWPVSWDASLYSHLYSIPMRNAFEYMRFSIGFEATKKSNEASWDVSEERLSGVEPMPFVLSSPREQVYNILYR